MPPPSAPGAPEAGDETEALRRFREEWKAELQSKLTGATSSTSTAALPSEPHAPVTSSAASNTALLSSLATKLGRRSTHVHASKMPDPHPAVTDSAGPPLSDHLRRALDTYGQAVVHEQRGELEDAIHLYRQAFQLDHNVDRLYYREKMLSDAIQKRDQSSTRPRGSEDLNKLAETTYNIPTVSEPKVVQAAIGTLAHIIAGFPQPLEFEPDDEDEVVPIRILPHDLLVLILRKLDFCAVERFALACRKARVVTLDPLIWRHFVSRIYRPPQIPDLQSMVAVEDRYLPDYRRLCIEHPRVRFDGVYIATCHYIRPGLSENSWVNITHLITYHRYLRFFPNGQVLSLLANEEIIPQQVIPVLKPTLRMKGLSIGEWCLTDTIVHLSNLSDASGSFAIMTTQSGSNTIAPGVSPAQSRTRLDISTYDSVNMMTGDIFPIGLKHERPFWFSKVRSY